MRGRDPAWLRDLHQGPHIRQFAGAQQSSQRKSRRFLHPITSIQAERTDQSIETLAGRAGPVTEIQPVELDGDPLDNSAHALIRRVDLAEEANFSLPASVRNRDGVPQPRLVFL